MKDFVCKINKCTSQLSWRLTKCKNEAGFLIQPQIILPNLFETIGDGILKQSVFLTSRLCLPSRLKLFEHRKSTPKCWLFFGGEMLLNPILNPNIWSLNANFEIIGIGKHAPWVYHAYQWLWSSPFLSSWRQTKVCVSLDGYHVIMW